MKKLTLILALTVQFIPFGAAFAADEACGREIFTREDLSNPYAFVKKTLEWPSGLEAERLVQAIERNANEESNGFRRPCLPNTRSCFGQDQAWTYKKESIFDGFGNFYQFNGEITSKAFTDWPTEKLYAHQTRIGYSCSWREGLRPQCEKWCSLAVKDDRFHD